MISRKDSLFVAIKNMFKEMKNGPLYAALIITIISLFTVYSATTHKEGGFFYKEIVWIILGVGVYIFFSLIDYRLYAKYSKVIYIVNVVLLLLVFIIGDKRLGARRWIDFGPITIQPSEFAKLFIVLTFANYLHTNYGNKCKGFKDMFFTALHIIPIFLLIAGEPDLGTSLVILFLYIVMIFINGIDWFSIGTLGISGIAMIPIAYKFLLKDYQRDRVLTFLHPESDLQGNGWNVMQSMIAVGSGGIFGKGFLNGTQSKLSFLPESHTDFIGAVFLEERGLIGGILLLLLYLALLWGIMQIGDKAIDGYGRLLCYGICAIFFFHIIVNIGMIMAVMPVTGLPLLLMSYGGTSFLFAFAMLGIVQSVHLHKEIEE